MLRDHTSQPDFELTHNHQLLATKALLQIQNPDGKFKTVQGSASSAISVNFDNEVEQSAFGELSVTNMTPVVQELFTYNINSRIWDTTTANSGTVSIVDHMANVGSGTTTASTSKLQSIHRVKYRPGEGVLGRFTALFTSGVAGTTQLAGVGDDDNGFFFGYNGTSFGIMHRNSASGSKVETWVAQSAWNNDTADGAQVLPTLDPTKGNVYEIKFQFLGYGAILFYVNNVDNGRFHLVHIIKYGNSNTVPSLSNSSVPFQMYAGNGATTSDIVVRSASVLLGVDGPESRLGIRNALSQEVTGIGSTDTAIFTLRNLSTYNSKTNTGKVYINMVNVSAIQNASSRAAIIKLVYGATLGGTPSYSAIDLGESIVEYDVAGTTVSGGNTIFAVAVRADDSANINIDHLDIHIEPGETITLAASTATGTVDIFGCLSWLEDI